MKAVFQKLKTHIKGGLGMVDVIDVHDLPEEQVSLIQEFVEFLRRKLKPKQLIKEEEEKDKEWGKLAMTSFAKDWENEKDAIYDNWKELYHVSER